MDEAKNKTQNIEAPELKATYCPSPTTTRGAPTQIGLHPKEQKVIYCSGKVVVIRDLDDPTSCFVYRGHNKPTTVARFSPNGYWVASGDTTGRVRVWSYDNPEHTLKIEVPVFSGEIKDLSWGPESKRIVAVGDGRALMARVFMWDTGNSVGKIVGHNKRILSVDYKPNRPYRIMTAAEDFYVCHFEGPPFKFARSHTELHNKFVNCIRYSPDGSKAVSVGSDRRMIMYDGKTSEVLFTFPEEHTLSIYSVCWSPDGSSILTASGDKTCKLWDVETHQVVKTFCFSETPQLEHMQVAVAWSSKYMISVSLSGDINILDTSNPKKPTLVIQGHQVSIISLTADPTSGTIITGSYDGAVCVWKDGVAKRVVGSGHSNKVSAVGAHRGHVYSAGWDDTLRFVETGVDTPQFTKSVVLNGQPTGIAVSQQDPGVVVVSTSKCVVVVKDGCIQSSTAEFSWTPTCVALSPDGFMLAVGSKEDMKIRLFNVVGSELTENGDISGHRGELTAVQFSPDGSLLAAGDSNREVRVWEVDSRLARVESSWVYHSTRITGIAWDPSGKIIASGSLDERIYIWDVEKKLRRKNFDFAHKDGVTGVVFKDLKTLLSIGNDACLKSWEINCTD